MSRLLDHPMPHFEGETGAGNGGAPPAPAPLAPQPPAAPAPPAADQSNDHIRRLESELSAARQEAAGYRIGNKGQIKEFREALGLNPDEDLTSIPKRIAAMESENRQLKIDHALTDVYGKHGVHPELTRKLLFADGVLTSIDPAQADFSKALNAAVKDLADKYPQVKIAAPPPPGAPRSGPDLPPGGAGTPPQLTKEDIANMSPPQVTAALKAGQLNGLLKRGG